ncbi:hypothetical protein ACFPPD_14495 [Cohnella suwonensis]|uniref:ATPase n=1 Tax=Cohnella suwonensis TaxID=696072 RepID=A0ABW0LVP4_9BACL
MNYDTDAWVQFAQDHWVVIAVAIVAIFVVMKLVKTVVKWMLVAAIVIGIGAYGGYTIDDIQKEVTKIGDKVTSEVKDQAIKAMAGEAAEATYADNADGSYSIKSTNLELTGVPNSGEVSVKFHGQSLGTWKMEGAVKEYVIQARAAAK